MLRLKPSDIGGELLQDSNEKLRVLENFVQFATDMNLKQFEKSRTKFIWELVPQSLPGRNIVRGQQAFDLYRKQWPADIFYFASEYALVDADVAKISIPKTGQLPDIPSYLCGDYSVAHNNLKWALIRNHEEGQMPIEPIFIARI